MSGAGWHDVSRCGEKWGPWSEVTTEETETSSPGKETGNGCSSLAFRGMFDHSLDNRGRMAVPARYRDVFAGGGVITQSADGCLELYTAAEFDRTAEDLTREPANRQRGRRLRRALYGHSTEVELDGQGRILIPARFRDQAGITGQAVLLGRRECLEIWSPEVWESESTVVESEFRANLEASSGEGTA